jgi:hypothetical protein
MISTSDTGTPCPIETVAKPTVGNCENAPHEYVGAIRHRYLADLAEMDPHDACFFTGMGEVIARRLHGH